MATLNTTTIIGHLGGNPELRKTNTTGKSVCNFSVGVNDSWKDKVSGVKQERTTWFRVVCWAGLAEVVAANMTIGKQVYVEGRIEEEQYQIQHKDPVSGQVMFYANGQPIMETHKGWKLIARDVQFLGKKDAANAYVAPPVAAVAAAPIAAAPIAAAPAVTFIQPAPAVAAAPVAAAPVVAAPVVAADANAVAGTFVPPVVVAPGV